MSSHRFVSVRIHKTVLALAGLLALVSTTPLPAEARNDVTGAEQVRGLNIMLMVTSLRCRTTPDNFTAEYGRFTTNHSNELNRATQQLRAEIVARHGPSGADREMDRLSTSLTAVFPVSTEVTPAFKATPSTDAYAATPCTRSTEPGSMRDCEETVERLGRYLAKRG